MIRSVLALFALILFSSAADAGPIGRAIFGARSSGCAGDAQACSGTQAAGCAGRQSAGCAGSVTVTTRTYSMSSHSTPPKAKSAPKRRSNDLAGSCAAESPTVTAVVVETRRPGLFGRLFGRRETLVLVGPP